MYIRMSQKTCKIDNFFQKKYKESILMLYIYIKGNNYFGLTIQLLKTTTTCNSYSIN